MIYYKKIFKSVLEFIKFKEQLKNLLIFIPIFFSEEIFSINYNFIVSLKIFIIFLLATSLIYSFNNIIDYNDDILTKKKYYHDIFDKKTLYKILLIIFIFFLYFILTIDLSKFTKILISSYVFIFFIYSLIIKKILYIDIITICVGYIIRILSASIETNIGIHYFLYLIIFFLIFFILSCKRFSELNKFRNENQTKAKYHPKILKIFVILSGLAVITFHFLYSNFLSNFDYDNISIIFLNLFVLIIVTRIAYASLTNFKLVDPTKFLIQKDLVSQTIIFFYLFINILKIYILN